MSDSPIKFRIQAGQLVFEIEGATAFVQKQLDIHRDHIKAILAEQARLIKEGPDSVPAAAPAAKKGRRPGRPKGVAKAAAPKKAGRRPGRQPSIVRVSNLQLKVGKLAQLKKFVTALAGGSKLGKDASVFAIAYFLSTEVLKSDTFSAGDVIAAYRQLGAIPAVSAPEGVDVVQMLRNLAATSIGKQWVARNDDGTFSLTAKGRVVGQSGQVVRPRGRRPGTVPAKAGAPKNVKKAPGRRGRPRKVVEGAPVAPKPGRKKAAVKKTVVKGARRGRPPKIKV